jgi:uncharacterized protein
MPTSLPPYPNLEQLRKQAKDLRKAHGRGDSEAAHRLRAHVHRCYNLDDAEVLAAELALRECQHVVSREHGYPDWQHLLDALVNQPGPSKPQAVVVDTVTYCEDELVPVQILRVVLKDAAPLESTGIVVLRTPEDQAVKITVGRYEGTALHRCLDNKPLPRPLTHELLDSCLHHLGVTVEGVVVHTLDEQGVYLAHVRLRTAEGLVVVDTRPSDGLVLAALRGASIFVTGQVLERAGQAMSEALAGLDGPPDGGGG